MDAAPRAGVAAGPLVWRLKALAAPQPLGDPLDFLGHHPQYRSPVAAQRRSASSSTPTPITQLPSQEAPRGQLQSREHRLPFVIGHCPVHHHIRRKRGN